MRPAIEALDFSAPYNNDPETLEEIFALKNSGQNRVREIYLSGPQSHAGSGRVTPKIDIEEFLRIVDRIHSEGIKVNLVLNSTCEGTEWYSSAAVNATLEYIRLSHLEHGVESVTLANPLYIREVRRYFPDLDICASVLSDVGCLQKATLYKEMGANIITPDVNINRDLALLREIKETTHVELKLMVNEGCLNNCPFRKFHFNITSHASKEPVKTLADLPLANFFTLCNQVIDADHAQILKSCWIRPEDLRRYSGITSFFKLVGRNLKKAKHLRILRAYLQEEWAGDLLDLMCASIGNYTLNHGAFLDNKSLDQYKFFERVTTCDRHCRQCGYCDEIAQRLLCLDVFTPEKARDAMDALPVVTKACS